VLGGSDPAIGSTRILSQAPKQAPLAAFGVDEGVELALLQSARANADRRPFWWRHDNLEKNGRFGPCTLTLPIGGGMVPTAPFVASPVPEPSILLLPEPWLQ